MRVINYDELFNEFKPSGYVGAEANTIANTLICNLHIQAGNGLARFLSVDTCFDNYRALRVWVQRRLDAYESYGIDEMGCQLETELYALLPNTGYGL